VAARAGVRFIDGWQLTGKAVATIVGGRFAYRAD
jgi:hypothetical protein